MIRIIISLSILILVILILRKCLYHHISRRLQYALWLTVPLYLILVPFIHIDVPILREQKTLETTITQKTLNTALQIINSKESTGTNLSSSSSSKSKDVENINKSNKKYRKKETNKNTISSFHSSTKLWYIIYFVISMVLFLFLICKNGYFLANCRRNRQFLKTDSKTGLNIYLLEGIHSPFLLWKSVYVSSAMIANKTQFTYMFLHEYCHWKHKDPLWNTLKHILMVCFWYHPLFWIASYYEECDCELACDEAVLKRIEEENISHCPTAYCGRCEQHFGVGAFTSPTVRFGRQLQTLNGVTAHCRSLI